MAFELMHSEDYSMDPSGQCQSCDLLVRRYYRMRLTAIPDDIFWVAEVHIFTPLHFGWAWKGRRSELHAFCSRECLENSNDVEPDHVMDFSEDPNPVVRQRTCTRGNPYPIMALHSPRTPGTVASIMYNIH